MVASRPGQELGDLARFLPEGLTVEPAGEAGFKAAASQANPLSDVELRTYVLRNPAGETAPFYLLPGLDIEISASEIRAQVQSLSRDSAARSLPAPVADYIRTHSVYR